MTKRHSSLLGILVESFLTRRLIQQQQASPATVSAYKDALRLLFRFASSRLGRPVDQLDIRDLDYELVLAFLDFLEKERGNSVRTRNARLAVVHSFFQHVAYAEPDLLALSQRILSIGAKRTTKRVVAFLQPPEGRHYWLPQIVVPNRDGVTTPCCCSFCTLAFVLLKRSGSTRSILPCAPRPRCWFTARDRSNAYCRSPTTWQWSCAI